MALSFPGDEKKQIHMEGYAVSAQCMALVRDDCLVPTKDAPELGYIRESTDKQYVPDVYYKVSGSKGFLSVGGSYQKREKTEFYLKFFILLFLKIHSRFLTVIVSRWLQM